MVALAGSTGSGKSSTFNALAGRELAVTGVRRPTTSVTQAAVFERSPSLGADAVGLLDWLDVHQHEVVVDEGLAGLVLLDLPDHDSTQPAHRAEVDRLVQVVDVFVWVVDPQKYADAALHRDYLQHFAGHADVTIVVLNQIDRLAPEDRRPALDDVARLLAADGLAVARPGVVAKVTGRDEGVRVLGVSALTGEGIDALRREVAARVSAHRALVDRIGADVDWIADDLDAALGTPPSASVRDGPRSSGWPTHWRRPPGPTSWRTPSAAAHRRRGAVVAGWPPATVIGRLRPDPLRRLGLDRRRCDASAGDELTPARTSMPPPSPVATAAVSGAIRQLADDAATGLSATWRTRLHEVAGARRADLDDALDRAVGTAPLPTDRPRWWSMLGWVQQLLALAMVVGSGVAGGDVRRPLVRPPGPADREARRDPAADRAGAGGRRGRAAAGGTGPMGHRRRRAATRRARPASDHRGHRRGRSRA